MNGARPTFATLTDDMMYEVVLRRDAAYDGVFYTGVLSTGIYCLPSCTCRTPYRANVRFFPTPAAAERAGLRPCKRCCPQLEGGRRGYEAALVAQAQRLIDECLEDLTVARVAAAVALSPHYLTRLFRRVAGMPLGAYIRARRAEQAAALLRAGDHSIVEVSAAVGFRSLSGLYDTFQRTGRLPPGAYRRAHSAPAHEAGV
jgi:methylphosphotriester-DNA--protein-cysteine methyltransferase